MSIATAARGSRIKARVGHLVVPKNPGRPPIVIVGILTRHAFDVMPELPYSRNVPISTEALSSIMFCLLLPPCTS
ncbi:unnamed protein product [Urochloa humidicola]